MAKILDGKAAAAAMEREAAERAADFASRHGRKPGLAVILAGDDPASKTYVGKKEQAAERAGLTSTTRLFDGSVSTDELKEAVESLNADPSVDGILVQLPLPNGVDQETVLDAVDFKKDVDGFHPTNLGLLLQGKPCLAPCTPSGIMRLLAENDVAAEGARAVVLGRSLIVGKPMAILLLQANATVTVCHSRTRDLPQVCRQADILVAAVGRPGFVDRTFVGEGAVVVDVGMNRVAEEEMAQRLWGGTPRFEKFRERGSLLAGDVHFNDVEPVARAITPVPGGVGPLTVGHLLLNTVAAAERRQT